MKKPSSDWRRAKETTLGAIFCTVRYVASKVAWGRVLVRKPWVAWFLTHPWSAVYTAVGSALFAALNPIGFIVAVLVVVAVYAIILQEYEAAIGAFFLAIAIPMIVLLLGTLSVVSFGIIPLVFYLWTRWWMTTPPVTVTVSEETRAKLSKLGRGD
jgi:hypothetical protein